jgi:hypothetical protein
MTLEIVLKLKVTKDKAQQNLPVSPDFKVLFQKHIQKWQENWRSMGVIILPDGDYARTFYRSLHWLQCTAGADTNLPGENQFASLSSRIAMEYNLQADAYQNSYTWEQRPFTYGAAGWSAYAYMSMGDRIRAGKMLANYYYSPDVLKKNAITMFPVGEYEYSYHNQKKGKYEYLSGKNPYALCFAHEMLFNGATCLNFPYEQQIHVQAFGPSLFYRYGYLHQAKEDTVYNVMRGSAEFWSDILKYDSKRKVYSLPPVLSLSENIFESDLLDGLLGAKWVLMRAASLAEKRDTDNELRKKWLNIAKNIRIQDKDDVYLEWSDDDGKREGAGYWGIRGYSYLGFPTLELMKDLSAKKVNKSLDLCWERNKRGEGMVSFTASWFAVTDACWGRAEEAYEKSAFSLSFLDPSGTAMCEQNKTMYYFLTSYASFTMVPVYMVLQSVGNEIRVFPAVPKVFADMEFYNLPATNGIRVSGVMKGGKTQSARFEKNGKTLLEVKGKDHISVTIKGDKLVLNKN